MTGLLKAAVETGTGRQAQMGRELAGKTGTTSSNKDGWFIGFTSDLVAGVWMGRDDARALPGLAGGRAPARAFAAFMGRASRGTPGGALTTEVPIDQAGGEPDAEVYGQVPPDGGEEPGPVSADGAGGDGADAGPAPDQVSPNEGDGPPPDPPRLDDRWLDRTLNDRDRAPGA